MAAPFEKCARTSIAAASKEPTKIPERRNARMKDRDSQKQSDQTRLYRHACCCRLGAGDEMEQDYTNDRNRDKEIAGAVL
jgi:hypothetical protein